MNIGFNLWNKQVFNAFPFPWTVSAVHVVVGLLYCTVSYLLGFKKASFGRVSLAITPVSASDAETSETARKGCSWTPRPILSWVPAHIMPK